jgi:hypothetical protein
VTVDSDDFVLPHDLADKYRDQANLVHAAPPSKKLDTLQRVAQRVAGLVRPDKFPRQQAIDRLWVTADAAGLVRAYGDDVIQQLLAAAFSDPIFPESVGSQLSADDQARPTGSEHADLDYSVENVNSRYAVVKVGRSVAIYEENPNAPVGEKVRMLEPRAFKLWFENTSTSVIVDGRTRWMSHGERWLRDPQRRQYDGVTFFPDPFNAAPTPGYLNLWRGFSYTPATNPDWRKYKTFKEHLLSNLCHGNEDHFHYVFGFFAQMFQEPRNRPGVALVVRGDKGAGKSKVGEVFGALLGPHHLIVDSPRYVTGTFNAHLWQCVLLQADEALWAGDKTVEGRLKGLITAPVQQIESKGIDPIQLPNYVHLLMTSNADSVVPASKDERRFAAFDISNDCIGNFNFFAQIDKEMKEGGFEHLLGDLLKFDFHTVDLRRPPQTPALLDQKIEMLDSVDRWWLHCLLRGATTRSSEGWQAVIPTTVLYDDYAAEAERVGHR